MTDTPILECQDCGSSLRYLTPEEVQKVAMNPERYIAYCGPCGRARMEQLKEEMTRGLS